MLRTFTSFIALKDPIFLASLGLPKHDPLQAQVCDPSPTILLFPHPPAHGQQNPMASEEGRYEQNFDSCKSIQKPLGAPLRRYIVNTDV